MKTLQDYIKLAESATDGPWEIKKYQGEIDCIGPIRSDEYAGTSWITAEDEDAQFIAASRTLAPAMAKALIEAEEIFITWPGTEAINADESVGVEWMKKVNKWVVAIQRIKENG